MTESTNPDPDFVDGSPHLMVGDGEVQSRGKVIWGIILLVVVVAVAAYFLIK